MDKICYKKDSSDRIRVTEFHLDGSNIIHKSGLLDGKLKVTVVPCKPKNVGRSNETTGEQQAVLELNARYKKKIDEGYFPTIQKAQNEVVILPMLAKSVNLERLVFPVIISPKLDGMRCMGQGIVYETNSDFKSRKGKWIDTVNHIKLPLLYVDNVFEPNAWFDGELYAHGEDFQTNISYIKKYKKGLTEQIKYHIYDVYIPNSTLTYKDRHNIITDSLKNVPNVSVVPYVEVNSVKEIKEQHQQFISDGYEGSMIRIDEVPYELNKRSHSLLKYKDFIDETYKIIDIVPNEKTPLQGTVICKLGDSTFKCGMKMSHEQREKLLTDKNKYIGSLAEVRFFEYSQNGTPRFPVCVGIRIDK